MKILIIEDEVKLLSLLKEGLTEEGHDVEVAKEGKDGLIKYVNEPFDLIILDWQLPELSGLEVCERIRRHNKKTPIIFLTSRDALEDVVAGLESGANDYIKKPFSFAELIARVNVYSRNAGSEMDEYHLGDIVIYSTTYKVFRQGIEIPLTLLEFELLRYLAKNKGKVTSRTEILRNVWGINYEYDTGVIDVFINAIRKKLGITRRDERIRAVRGRGFITNDI